MIARCGGIDCRLKDTCYRYLMPNNGKDGTWAQALYSFTNRSCKNYWQIVKKSEQTFLDSHVARLNTMIDRLK